MATAEHRPRLPSEREPFAAGSGALLAAGSSKLPRVWLQSVQSVQRVGSRSLRAGWNRAMAQLSCAAAGLRKTRDRAAQSPELALDAPAKLAEVTIQ